MRRLTIAVAVILLLLAGVTAVLWTNRVPLAEWAIDTYQPETPLGPVSVRIGEITLSSVTISEIRARYRGPIALQDVTAEFAFGEDWHPTLSSIRIGSLNAALSFADWRDLLDTFGSEGTEGRAHEMALLPVSIGDITVETMDLYAETPKGYALVNGNLAFRGTADLSRSDAVEQIADGIEGNLLLSAGATGFPVRNGASGGGSLVLTAAFARNSMQIQAVTPLRFALEISEPLAELPSLPTGTYRADIGSDEVPFQMTLGYGVEPASGLRSLSFSPFPFALDTPFGTAEAQATTSPIALTDGAADPATLPVGLEGTLKLAGVPLPGGIIADIAGGFEIDKGDKTTIGLEKGFRVTADISSSKLLMDLPQAIKDIVSDTLVVSTKSKVSVDLASGDDGNRFVGTGIVAMESGGLSVALPSGLSFHRRPGGGIEAGAESITMDLDSAKGPSPVDGAISLALGGVSFSLTDDGKIAGRGGYTVKAKAGESRGRFEVEKAGGETTVRIVDGSGRAGEPALVIPAFGATAKLGKDGIDLSATVEEVQLGDLQALKRPFVLTGHATFDDLGVDFDATGSIDDVVAVNAKGSYVDGEFVMTFGSGEIPLGPGGADLGELTDLVDLGQSAPNGSIRVEGELTYQHGAISGYADLHITEIGSQLVDGTEISVLGTVSFDLSRFPATRVPATLTGVLSSDILGNVPFKETFTLRETGEMDIQSLEAQVLGGTVTVLEGIADAAAGTLVGRLHADNIDLDALADMLSIEGLGGTGRLTGDLGFQVTEEAVIVEAGELKADKPGTLRYQGEALTAAAAGNENLALLVQALENFHYEVLTLGIDIPEFGEGIVTLHLEGKNPDVLEGYPFDVTINLESDYGRLIKIFLTLYREMDSIMQGVLR